MLSISLLLSDVQHHRQSISYTLEQKMTSCSEDCRSFFGRSCSVFFYNEFFLLQGKLLRLRRICQIPRSLWKFNFYTTVTEDKRPYNLQPTFLNASNKNYRNHLYNSEMFEMTLCFKEYWWHRTSFVIQLSNITCSRNYIPLYQLVNTVTPVYISQPKGLKIGSIVDKWLYQRSIML